MGNNLFVYNTLTKTKQKFVSSHEDVVGMYVYVPMVYGKAHLGHTRLDVTFDLIFKYLKHIDHMVRYVRNITDVGHLIGEV